MPGPKGRENQPVFQGAKAPCSLRNAECKCRGECPALNRLRKKGEFRTRQSNSTWQALKPGRDFAALTARLKASPDTKQRFSAACKGRENQTLFRGLKPPAPSKMPICKCRGNTRAERPRKSSYFQWLKRFGPSEAAVYGCSTGPTVRGCGFLTVGPCHPRTYLI